MRNKDVLKRCLCHLIYQNVETMDPLKRTIIFLGTSSWGNENAPSSGKGVCIQKRDSTLFYNLARSPCRVSNTEARMGQWWMGSNLDLEWLNQLELISNLQIWNSKWPICHLTSL